MGRVGGKQRRKLDARTKAAIGQLREGDWSEVVTADGKADTSAQVAELTGLLRDSAGGDQLDGVLAGRPADDRPPHPRQPGEQAELGQDADWRYGAFATSTANRAAPAPRRPPPALRPRSRTR
jgi:hypothetical protein